MQEINPEIYQKKKLIKRQNIEEIDLIICLKKNQKVKEYQKKYRKANKSRKSYFNEKNP